MISLREREGEDVDFEPQAPHALTRLDACPYCGTTIAPVFHDTTVIECQSFGHLLGWNGQLTLGFGEAT